MTSDEVTEMMAFEGLEPFGALREEMRLGVIAAVIANCNRDPKRTPEPFQPADFMPALRRELDGVARPRRVIGEGMSPDELSALIDAEIFGRTLH